MNTVILVALGVLLVGHLILRVEQRRLSAQFDAAAEEARQAITLTQALSARERDMTDRLSSSSASIQRATDRIEAAAAAVASDLRAVVPNTMILEATDRIEAQAAHVASDLADSHKRANAVTNGNHGEAADAASQKEDG